MHGPLALKDLYTLVLSTATKASSFGLDLCWCISSPHNKSALNFNVISPAFERLNKPWLCKLMCGSGVVWFKLRLDGLLTHIFFFSPLWLNMCPTSGHNTCPPLLTGVESWSVKLILFSDFSTYSQQKLPVSRSSCCIYFINNSRTFLFAVSPRVEFLPDRVKQAQTWLGVELIVNAWKWARNNVRYIYNYTCICCVHERMSSSCRKHKTLQLFYPPFSAPPPSFSSFINVISPQHKV